MRALAVRRWLCVCAGLFGCDDPKPAIPDAATVDAAVDAGGDAAVDAAGITWESVDVISNDGGVIVEEVSYRSGGLLITGRVCRPADTDKHAMLVYNHLGVSGVNADPQVGSCEESARLGLVWIGSSYRGEGGSEGTVEFCLGEVDDVLAMIEVANAQPYVDPSHVVMWGSSHGGCVTMRAVQRGAPVRAAVDLFGPTDWAALHQYWVDTGGGGFRTMLEAAAGGTPTQVPAAYAARSPIHYIADVPSNVAVFVAHGLPDDTVPISQACDLAVALSLDSYQLDTNGQQVTSAVTGCGDVTWKSAPRSGWGGTRYFIAYDGLGHINAGTAFDPVKSDIGLFLLTKAN